MARKTNPTRRPVRAEVEISGFRMRFTISLPLVAVELVPDAAVAFATVAEVAVSFLVSAAIAHTASRTAIRMTERRDIVM